MTTTEALLRDALEGTLDWLASYPGGGAIKCWERARAALSAAPVAAPPTQNSVRICQTSPVSSRICERGTPTCVVEHVPAAAPQDANER